MHTQCLSDFLVLVNFFKVFFKLIIIIIIIIIVYIYHILLCHIKHFSVWEKSTIYIKIEYILLLNCISNLVEF